YQERFFNSKRKAPHIYKVGELVTVRNFESTLGVSKKILPTFRGPYEVKKILRNDRYFISDLPGFKIRRDSKNKRVWDALGFTYEAATHM
ncbi:hypothetical protein ALC56_09151, partial [Trachymyrmex septentrionalis]